MNKGLAFLILMTVSSNLFSQHSVNNESKPYSDNVDRAVEVESLFPMFLTGGFHVAAGYRYKKIRVRASVINGGNYNAEKAGINNSSDDFKRRYKTSPGIFLGYAVWKNLEVYTFAEFHTFEIAQRSTGSRKDMHSTDLGGGIGYQFFVWKGAYVQPAVHFYFRKSKSLDFDNAVYTIPRVDFSPVIRIGYRLWSR